MLADSIQEQQFNADGRFSLAGWTVSGSGCGIGPGRGTRVLTVSSFCCRDVNRTFDRMIVGQSVFQVTASLLARAIVPGPVPAP